MKIVTPPLEVNENDGFINDALDRKSFGEALRNIVLNSSDEMVISLDGRWGEGKTTFVKMWQGLLNESNIPNIYINAFETDYVDDPFIAVASSITDYIDEKIPKESKTKYVENAKNVGVRFLSWSTKIGIKAATLNLIKDSDIDELKDISKDLAKGVSSVVGNFVEERLTSHKEDIQAIDSFKELLSNLPKQLREHESDEEPTKPLVIIIDELDRCKPTYALEMIEKVKHLFSVKNVVFVLVMNKKHIEDSIKCLYGQIVNPHEYLQKFINIETNIPKPLKGPNLENHEIEAYAKILVSKHEIAMFFVERYRLLEFIVLCSKHWNLSLRQLERVFTNLTLFFSSTDSNTKFLFPLIALLAVIKVVDTGLFEDIKNNNVDFHGIIDRTKVSDHSVFHYNDYLRYHLELCFADLNDLRNESNQKINNLFNHYDLQPTECQSILTNYTHKFSMFNVS